MDGKTKPAVHCFVGRLKSGGKGIRAIRRVTLAAAYLAKQDGWKVLGPDPLDMEALAQWEADHQFNRPRLR
jgi:hypothetical protein